jgi:hypothetical protein
MPTSSAKARKSARVPLVRYTALAAVQMDYPPKKLHAHILDDCRPRRS